MKLVIATRIGLASVLLHVSMSAAWCPSTFLVPVPGSYGLTLNWGIVTSMVPYCNTSAGLYDEYDTATGNLLRQNIPRGVHSSWAGGVTTPPSGWGITWHFRFLPFQGYGSYTATSTHLDFLGDSETDVVFVFP